MSASAMATPAPIVNVRRARPSKSSRKASLNSSSKSRMPSVDDHSKSARASNLSMPIEYMPASDSISRGEVGHPSSECHASVAGLVAEIRETHRRRQDFHRAEKSLTLQIKAIERRLSGATPAMTPNGELPRDFQDSEGQDDVDFPVSNAAAVTQNGEEQDQCHSASDTPQASADNVLFFATLPLAEARATIKKHRLQVERLCVKLAKQLPAYSFVESVNGFGALGLAQIVGEAGDLSNYSNPAKLWKRMGLAVINGKSQRRVAGAAALEQGYSPVRRAIMFCIGDSLLKKQNPYRELYLERKVFEQSKVPDGAKMLWHRRAQRYVEKRLLRDLWRAWRDQKTTELP